MGKVNLGRIILGGLLAGLVINISEFVLNTIVIASDLDAAMKAMNKTMDNSMIAWFVIAGFALGILAVWLYAAIRPRFGPGVKTAVIAALAVYFLSYVYPSVFVGAMQLFPARVMIISLCWGIPEIIIGSIAGAWLYTEG
jgi:antibiotic biosynthesis monooxygenase (ABM) superfamily enzyme